MTFAIAFANPLYPRLTEKTGQVKKNEGSEKKRAGLINIEQTRANVQDNKASRHISSTYI